MAASANPCGLTTALSRLQEARISTPENRALVLVHVNPSSLSYALSYLQEAGILNQENRALVAAHVKPEDLTSALPCLQRAGISTAENRALAAAHVNPRDLSMALSDLQRAGILTQDNFSALVAPNHVALVTIEAYGAIWWRIPIHLLTTINFQRLLAAAEHANPMTELYPQDCKDGCSDVDTAIWKRS